MEGKDGVPPVGQSSSAGCSNAPGRSCHWHKEYLRLKEKFDNYKHQVEGEVRKMSTMEAKILVFKEETEKYKHLVEREREDISRKYESLEQEKVQAFENGRETAKKEAQARVDFYQTIKAEAESHSLVTHEKLLSLQRDYDSLKSSLERKILMMEQNTELFMKRNQTLEDDLLAVRIDANNTISSYRDLKRKAVEDYVSLHEQHIELKVSHLENTNKIKEMERRNAILTKDYERLLLEAAEFKEEEAERQRKYDVDTQKYISDMQSEMEKDFKNNLASVKSQLADVTTDLALKNEVISQILENEKIQDEALTGTALRLQNEMRTTLTDLKNTLEKVESERKDAIQKKEELEKELEAMVDNFQNLNEDLYRFSEKTIGIFHDVMQAIGFPHKSPDVSEVHDFFKMQKQTSVIQDNCFEGMPKFLIKLKREETTFKKLIKFVKTWKESVESQQLRLSDRQASLEKQLEKEKLERLNDNENATAKIRSYKILIMKLRGRLENALKIVHPDSASVARYHDVQHAASQTILSSAVEAQKIEDYRLMLDRAEEVVMRIENFEISDGEVMDAVSPRRTSSLPNF